MEPDRRHSWRDRRQVQAGVVAVVVLMVVAGLVAVAPRAPGAPGAPTPSPSGSIGAAPSIAVVPTPSPSPTATGGTWAPYGPSAFHPPIALVADSSDAAGIAVDSTFTLRTGAGLDAATLARTLEVSPLVAYTVTAGADASVATVRPAGPLAAGQVYRFALHDAASTQLGSWAFQVAQPLHVASTLPGDMATGVPIDTGIEVTFDQDGATDVRSHVSISPAVDVRTEQHGRTFAFIPLKRLPERTIFTVTVRHGIAIAGSDEVLEKDVRFAFETGVAEATVPTADVALERSILEVSPRERVTVALRVDVPDEAKDVTSLPVRVFRISSQARALEALRTIMGGPGWAEYASTGLVDTSGLPRVMSFTARLRGFGDDSGGRWFRAPATLAAGWYVMVIDRPQRDLQIFLQVTDIATYAAVTTTRTVAWVNDSSKHGPVTGATVSLAGGALLGSTDRRGIAEGPTPAALLDALTGSYGKDEPAQPSNEQPVLIVRAGGRVAFAPLPRMGGSIHYVADLGGSGIEPAERFVDLLYTDRLVYRQTDEVQVWGLVRDRDRSALPGDVTISLIASDAADSSPALLTIPVTLRPTGAFAVTLPLRDIPIGGYLVRLSVGPLVVTSTDITVDLLRKPDYRIAVTTDRHAVVDGARVQVTTKLTFYDGTAVPDTQVHVESFYGSDGPEVDIPKTDATGSATALTTARIGSDVEGWLPQSIDATPLGPEEGNITGSSYVLVFPSSLWLDGQVTATGGRLVLTGSVHDVDFAALEKRASSGANDWGWWYDIDPAGRARPGLRVDAKIVELIPVRHLEGQEYDFITKRVVDKYSYTIRKATVGTWHLVSGQGGRLHLNVAIAHPDHAYQVVLSVRDAHGDPARLTMEAEAPPQASSADPRPYLAAKDQPESGYAVGDTVTTTLSDGRGALPSGGSNSYLFLTAQRGLRDLFVQSSPTLSQTFRTADVPSLEIVGVRFTGTTYSAVESGYTARFDGQTRALTVHLATDARSYRPGEQVTLTVETRDREGRPVAATVFLRAVDEKLFAIAAAGEIDPIVDLYHVVSSGIVLGRASRQDLVPEPGGGGGATGGGDGRGDFRDTLLFRTVTTAADGRTSVKFDLSDDLTSWHVSAAAITSKLEAGESSILVPVGLPFFVDAGIAPEYLVTDRPSIRVRAFGSALKTGDDVTFTISSTSLPMARTVVGKAFQPIDVPLPALTQGDHVVTVAATSGTGAKARSDTLIRHFTVIGSRLTATRTAFTDLGSATSPQHGDGLTTYVFSDAGRGRFIAPIDAATGTTGVRLDQVLASEIGRDLAKRWFGGSGGATGSTSIDAAASAFDPARYQASDGGLTLLPYSGSDLELSADVALQAGSRFSVSALRDYFMTIVDDPEATRERRIIALAGRAGLGDPVLPDIRAAAAATDLEPTEQLYVGLAAAALGDSAIALNMEAALLTAHGQRQGPWVRLAVPQGDDATIRATALLAMLAAEVGDPVADAAYAFVATHPATASVTSLVEMGYVAAAIGHATAAPASFAYTVDGKRTLVDLAPGEALRIELLAGQAAALRLEPISGSVGVATTWQAPADLSATPVDKTVRISRSWTPAGDISSTDLVRVTITVDFPARTGPQVDLGVDECYAVTDLAPSGTAPLAHMAKWPVENEDGTITPSEIVDPYAIEGQAVRFCATPAPYSNTATLRYYLRVVTTGTYTWEPAVAESSLAPSGLARTEPTTLVIR